jgi:hypothetical protein
MTRQTKNQNGPKGKKVDQYADPVERNSWKGICLALILIPLIAFVIR